MAIGPIDGLTFPECTTEDPPFGLSLSKPASATVRHFDRLSNGHLRRQMPLTSCPLRHAGTGYPFCLRSSSSRFCSSLSFFLPCGLLAAGLGS